MRRRFVILFFALLLVASEAGQAGRWKSKKKKKASISVGADGSTTKADAGPSTAETVARTAARGASGARSSARYEMIAESIFSEYVGAG